MRFSTRNLFGFVALAAILSILYATARGPVLTDCVAFYVPMIICAALSWQFFLKGKPTSTIRSFATGALAALIGTMIWPTGLLIVMLFLGNPDALPSLLECVAISLALGGTFASVLTLGFSSGTRPNNRSGNFSQSTAV